MIFYKSFIIANDEQLYECYCLFYIYIINKNFKALFSSRILRHTSVTFVKNFKFFITFQVNNKYYLVLNCRKKDVMVIIGLQILFRILKLSIGGFEGTLGYNFDLILLSLSHMESMSLLNVGEGLIAASARASTGL